MLVLVLATTIAWCIAATALTLARRDTVLSVRERTSPALLHALEAHAVLSDADRAVWASFRSGEAELIGPGQDYQDDITTAGQNLAQLAGLESTRGAASGQLQTVNGQLVNYQALVGQADATYRSAAASGSQAGSGRELGYAYLGYASNSLRDPQGGLLAGIDKVGAINREALRDHAAASWMSPWVLLVYAAAALPMLGVLLYTQAFLRRRFRRRISPELALATALAVGISVWLGVVAVNAERAFKTAHEGALPRLSAIWQKQTHAVDADARELRADVADEAHGARAAMPSTKAFRGLDIAATEPARRQLDSALAGAANTGGLVIALPIAAAAVAGLAFLGLRRRLDEYRG